MEASCSRFTPAEGGARLAMAAGEKNILVVEYGSFIATRLVHEDAYKIRGSLFDGRQRSIYLTRASRVPCVAYELHIMTDLAVTKAITYEDVYDWHAELDKKEVLVCTSSVLMRVLQEELLTMANINVLIIDSCHLIWRDDSLQYDIMLGSRDLPQSFHPHSWILGLGTEHKTELVVYRSSTDITYTVPQIMKLYKESGKEERPKILALTYPLFSSAKADKDPADNQNYTFNNDTETDLEKENDSIEKDAIDKDDGEVIAEKVTAKTEGGRRTDLEVGVYENIDDYEMYEKLEWKIEELEKALCCQMDLAEDIDGGKRLTGSSSKPRELIVEYSEPLPADKLPETYRDLDSFMRDVVNRALAFIDEHRYDPTEIYGDDLYEEFKNIPYPTIEPKHIFKQFLYVLDQLGPYAADKAAFSLLAKLEKLKIKVPYERHFLLLGLCTTVFVQIRCYADLVFSKLDSDWEKIRLFCTPKVLRFAEILQKFQPPEQVKSASEVTEQLLKDIDECDFKSLGNKIEDRVNTYVGNLKELDIESVTASDSDVVKTIVDSANCEGDKVEKAVNEDNRGRNQNEPGARTPKGDHSSDNASGKYAFTRRSGGRNRGRGRAQRGNATRAQQTQNPDALCGIVFMKEPLVAKIMFMLIVDMSRSHPKLSYLCAQYCAIDTPADPGTEPRECQRQSKKQEEVLKKFRMHECNLLLATSALEEGIDLPRCNLVLRWDVPASYRSYGLCRARARATRSCCTLMCCSDGKTTGQLVHNLATYKELDQIISRKCGCGVQDEPPESEETAADAYTLVIKPYAPQEQDKDINQRETVANGTKHTHIDSENNWKADIEKNEEDIDESAAIDKDFDVAEEHDGGSHLSRNGDKEGGNNTTKNVIIDTSVSIANEINSKNEFVEALSAVNEIKSDREDVVLTKDDATVINELEMDLKSMNLNIRPNVKCKSELSDSGTDCKSNNLVCNRCNSLKVSVNVECPCVNVLNVRYSVDNKEPKERSSDGDVASVDMGSAIALINRYCGKLPSDTFTRLAPQWWMEEVQLPVRGSGDTRTAYICTLRLPLNCPVKYNIVGHPMPTRVLARRMVALQACRILHKSGELDNQLMPIGKENFKAAELDTTLQYGNTAENDASDSARPGTTKRRQYYYKRTAWVFTDCQPIVDTSDSEIGPPMDRPEPIKPKPVKEGTKRNMLYAIVSKLWCALPERYNTRGRRLHAPQNASQAIGILMARHHNDDLQIPSFPVYTRSGEVRVAVEHVPHADVRVTPTRGRLVRRFMRFVFAEVLRVRRRGMKLQSEGSTHNNYYIVPTIKTTKEDGTSKIDVDWSFLELIYNYTEQKKLADIEKPLLWQEDDEDTPVKKVEKNKERDGKVKILENPLLKPGETFVFDPDKYREAVVTPWYRNQDQPQFFLVAEICWNLSPQSSFPSSSHATFREYYLTKYGARLTQPQQPLLDVDHTSARLNLLTPRYVNRKGVALPVSSERTRRAKRDRLDQKQILVPELCRVHPFAAPLWFATVALPCVLYRINALLIADEIRRAVSIDVGLGVPNIDEKTCPGFRWPPLDFGWSLAEVLNADSEKSEKKKEDGSVKEEKEANGEEDEKEKTDKEDGQNTTEEPPREKTINDILQEKEDAESGFEIGTWSNDMASSIPDSSEYDEYMEPLPSNLTFCTSASGGTNWCDPIEKPKSQFNPTRTFSMAESDCSYMSSDFDTDDSELNSDSDDDTESSGFWSKGSMGVRIEYKTAHEAEAVDIEKKKVNPAPQPDEEDDELDRHVHHECIREGDAPAQYINKFRASVVDHEADINQNGSLIAEGKPVTAVLPDTKDHRPPPPLAIDKAVLDELFPYGGEQLAITDGQITLDSIERNKRVLLARLKEQTDSRKLQCFSMVDVDVDSPGYVNEKVANVGFDDIDGYMEKVKAWGKAPEFKPYYLDGKAHGKGFDFDYQPPLEGHPGPSPSVILQALTMSNANDGINLERLETIGDSFLKFAITAYLYCAHPTVHEGKLSHMRSKQVSNLNLYRLGRSRRLGARMVASKFEPHDNWLPPCHRPPHANTTIHKDEKADAKPKTDGPVDSSGCFIPYNLITQHSIPDKSIADCVEALIGAYLLECGPRGALLFMSWLGIRVLPRHSLPLPPDHPYGAQGGHTQKVEEPPIASKPPAYDSESSCTSYSSDENATEPTPLPRAWAWPGRPVGSLKPQRVGSQWRQTIFGELKAPPSPLLRYIEDPEGELEQMLSGYDALERTLQYRFKDRSLLLQALTHASHQKNRLTDCYQRLEFLGDAVLDYLITRHLYEDPRRHSPGALTDLRSALVNNTIFATLAARHGFHKYFRHMSPGLNEVLTKYVKIQEENGHSISEEHYLIQEDEMEQAEDVEVPKALGDLFESVAGAIFLDSGMSLGAVWRSYVNLMGAELEAFSAAAPKSPVRELLEAEPDTAKFGKPERLADGRRVRVCVEVFGRGSFKGVGRNYRIAKGTAARCALRHLKIHRTR